MRALRGGGARAGVRERDGPGDAARRPRARVLAGPFARVEGSRPRARGGNTARLPPRASAASATRGSCTCATPRARSRTHADARGVDRRRSRGDVRAAGRSGRAARAARRLDRAAPSRRAARSAPPSADSLAADTAPIKPTRIYGELRKRLDRDAIVIGDGGDFVSYAGKLVDSFEPGTFLDPGPYGCLGMGPGYALAAGVAHPDRQVVLLLGDGAIGFALGDLESLVRHGINVTAIVGNNGIWGLEKHPMQALFGYDVVAELAPGIRYDKVVEALGGHGELVDDPGDLGPALDRALRDAGRLARERPHRPRRRLPAVVQPRLTDAASDVHGRDAQPSRPTLVETRQRSRVGISAPKPARRRALAFVRISTSRVRRTRVATSASVAARARRARRPRRRGATASASAASSSRPPIVSSRAPRRRRDRAVGRRRRRRTCAPDARTVRSSPRCAGRRARRGRSRRPVRGR